MTSLPPDHTDRSRYYTYGNYEDEPPVYGAPPARRRGRAGRIWLIVIVVIAGLLVAADRIAAAVTEDKLAAKIQTSQHLSQKPSVSISGFPFLTQVVSRNFGHATVDIANFNSGEVPIAHIHADLTGVHVSSGYNSATVDTLVGTATLEYSAVSRVLSRDISNIGQLNLSQGTGNQVKATYGVLGVNISADVAVNVLSGNSLEFKTTKIHTPLSGLGINASGFDVKVPLNGLPFGMKLSSLKVTSTGVDISATGTNVPLTESSVDTTG